MSLLLLLLCSPFSSHALVTPLPPWTSTTRTARNIPRTSTAPQQHNFQRTSLYLASPHNLNDSGSPRFTVASNEDKTIHTLTFHSLPGQNNTTPPAILQTGKIGRLAAGAIEYRRGDTVLYTTASRDFDPKDGLDFVPLSVDYQERFSSAGLTSGAFNKRDGRPAEHETLTCRLIDRPIRPLIASDWRHETQLLSWVLSYDGERSCETAAIVASAAALYISDIPLSKPVAAVQVGMTKEGAFIVNPTLEEMETSRLALTVAGTMDAVLMIEGEADFLPESVFIEALRVGHEAVVCLCQGIQALADVAGVEKMYSGDDKSEDIQQQQHVQQRVNELMTERVDEMFAAPGTKKQKGKLMNTVQKQAIAEINAELGDDVEESSILAAFKKLLSQRMFVRAKETGLRGDGRPIDKVRPLTMETRLLPRVHGSALFTRGETQALATATLGDAGMRQKLDKIGGMTTKRFYLQYTFPPSCVGETGRVGAPGRREVGHGNLAERALARALPTEKDFPYTIRVESLITESHGSSSMASVCGGCLALMDAGVPITKPVAGIAMGMLLGDDKSDVSEDNAIVLTDITGTEDALGMMDFKVAGDREGITTFQLDIKCEGLTFEVMERALEQAKIGRLHILDEMDKAVANSKMELPSTVPKMKSFSVPKETLGKIIGPGGRQIRSTIEDFGLVGMDIGEDGTIQMSSLDASQLEKAEEFVQKLITSGPSGGGGAGSGGGSGRKLLPPYNGTALVEGETYTGKITGIHNFGVFVEIIPPPEDGSTQGVEGLCHVSELARDHIRNCEGFVRGMGVEELTVKYLGKDHRGKVRLSRKAALEDQYGKENSKPKPKTNQSTARKFPQKIPKALSDLTNDMPKAELDVIAQAIEDI